jgi:hypothetical protein
MSNSSFTELLNMVGPQIIKQDTVMRRAIPVEERLEVTLRFLATGRSFECLKFSAIIFPNAISKIVAETCAAIISTLIDYIQVKKIYFRYSNFKFVLMVDVIQSCEH